MPMRTYYDVLGVDRAATTDIIKKAYLAKAKDLHPDMMGPSGQASPDYLEAKQAFETLTNPQLRLNYDANLESAPVELESAPVEDEEVEGERYWSEISLPLYLGRPRLQKLLQWQIVIGVLAVLGIVLMWMGAMPGIFRYAITTASSSSLGSSIPWEFAENGIFIAAIIILLVGLWHVVLGWRINLLRELTFWIVLGRMALGAFTLLAIIIGSLGLVIGHTFH